jgi:hypothetical protein
MPSIERISVSIGMTSRRSESSGEMPSCGIVTTKNGTSMCGSDSTRIALSDAMPAMTTIARISSVVRERWIAASMIAYIVGSRGRG